MVMAVSNAMTVGELKEALDDFGDHLKVIIEIDRTQHEVVDEEIFDVLEVNTMNVGGEIYVRIEWG
jgi:hypothetical protein